jgi:hypothetical protein
VSARLSSQWLWAALLAALWLRLLVPAGWMPVPATDGGSVLSLCSGGQLPAPDAPGTDHPSPCAFAGLSAPFVAAAAAVLVLPILLFFMPVAAPLPAVTVRQRAPRPPGQGPPLA